MAYRFMADCRRPQRVAGSMAGQWSAAAEMAVSGFGWLAGGILAVDGSSLARWY